MSFRGAQLFVQGQTRYRLTLLARVVPPVSRGNGEATSMSADELGDSLLNEIMLTKYPRLKELEAQLKVLEEAFSESIRDSGEKDAQAVPHLQRTERA